MTGMAVVTDMTRQETWKLVGTWQDLAIQTGLTSTEIANMATMYFQQGKQLSDVIKLTEAAAKAARIAGISGAEAINLMTNAMNGFQLASTQAMAVSDKFAALAAASATDFEELAVALSKVASQAHLAGMSMDFTLGLLAKGIEVTRESPETIGTALKTILARMRELTDYGKTLEDGLDVNRVAKALSNVGIDLMDPLTGQFRDMEAVITEVGKKWKDLTVNQQANVAVALAGTRQQSRLIAMMQDFDRTLELVDISANSYGATMAQHAKFMGGMEAATSRLTTSYEELITALTNSELIIGVVQRLGDALGFVADNGWWVWTTIALITSALVVNTIITSKATAATFAKIFAVKSEATEEQKAAFAKSLNNTYESGGIITKTIATIVLWKKIAAMKADEKVTWKTAAAQWGLNTSMYAFPIVAIVIAILAAIAALTIFIVWLVKVSKESRDMNKAIDKTIEALDALHAKLYELNQQQATVSKLADEFENLSNKIIRTVEETERLAAIIKELNELAGYQVVTADNYADQLIQIKAFQQRQKDEIAGTITDMKKALGTGYQDITKTARNQVGNYGDLTSEEEVEFSTKRDAGVQKIITIRFNSQCNS